jgi:hypothetical protein
MSIPRSKEARLHYRCAFDRLDDAQTLLRAAHTTGAVYLAGYGIECILKALALSGVPPARRSQMLLSYRGSRAHDFEWLWTTYLSNRGATAPRSVARAFALVNSYWSTDLRYSPRKVKPGEAERFLDSAQEIIRWADGRL